MNADALYRFEYLAPTKLVFGEGEISNIAKHLTFAEKILIVTGKNSALLSGALPKVKDAFRHCQLSYFNGVTANPRASEVNSAAEIGIRDGVQAVMGIGGGSVLDAAKAVAACIAAEGKVEPFLRNGIEAPDNTLPIICVPTTAGTGSEMSKGAIITDVEEQRKRGLRGAALLPRLAIVDPELTYSMPHHVTAETGFDIFTHAVETLVSKKASALTAILSEYSIKAVIEYLPKVLQNLQNKTARRMLMLASTIAGINLANSTTCLPHRMQYPLGAHTDCSHARGLAALYKAWCEATAPHAVDKFALIAEMLPGAPFSAQATAAEKAQSIGERVENFMKAVDVFHRMRDFGVMREMCKQMVHEIEGNLTTDPGETSDAALLKIYEASW